MKSIFLFAWRVALRFAGLCLYTVFFFFGMLIVMVKAAFPAIRWYYSRDYYSIELSGWILIGTILALWIISMIIILTYWPVHCRQKALALS